MKALLHLNEKQDSFSLLMLLLLILYALFSGEFVVWGIRIFFEDPGLFLPWVRSEPITFIVWIGRFMLIAPLSFISFITHISLDQLFTIFCRFLVIASSYRLVLIVEKFFELKPKHFNLIFAYFLLCLTCLATQMNGRMLFAHFGYIFLTDLLSPIKFINQTSVKSKTILSYLTCIVFISVSTGTLFTGCCLFLYCSSFARYKIGNRQSPPIILAPILLCVLFLILTGIKNISFFYLTNNSVFSGALIDLISHGFGKILIIAFETNEYHLALLLFAGICSLLVYTKAFNKLFITYHQKNVIITALFLPICVGVFGLSTLTLAIPIILLTSTMIMLRVVFSKYIPLKNL